MAASLFTTRRTLASLLSRRSRVSLPVLFHHLNHQQQQPAEEGRFASQTRFASSRSGCSPLNDPSPSWSGRPPKETILLDGCDFEHWFIVMEFNSDPRPTEEEMINSYVKTLASVVGSEEAAKEKIYSVCTIRYTWFGALISEELANQVRSIRHIFPPRVFFFWKSVSTNLKSCLPGVRWVFPDSYSHDEDYGGDLFINGKVIHRMWRVPKQGETPASDQPSPAEQSGASAVENVSRGVGGGNGSA